MTTINTLLEEFDKEFTREDGLIDKYSWYGQPEESIGPNSTPDAMKLFIRTAFTKYNSELAAKVGAMKKGLGHHSSGCMDAVCRICDAELHDGALDDVLALLKEENV